MSPSVRRQADHVRLELDPFELELLRSLPAGLKALLEAPDPADPAIARLFPACVVADDQADVELRRLIFDDLLRDRLEGLQALNAILDRAERRRGRYRIELVEDEPALVLGVLNDVRLTLGARLGIEHLERADVHVDHPAAATLAVMDHLAWIQEELLRVIDPPSSQHADA